MVKRTTAILLATTLLAACGGRAANPVPAMQYGDQSKSCNMLQMEMANTQADIQRLLPDTDKTGQNVALGVAGAFLLVPWFFMDFSHAEEIEFNALRQRHNTLAMIAMEKKCGFNPKMIEVQPRPEKANKNTSDYPSEK